MADAADSGGTGSGGSAAVAATAAVGGCGCLALPVGVGMLVVVLLVVGGLGVLLLPVVVLFLLFNGLPLGDLGGGGGGDLTAAEQRCEDVERLFGDSDPGAVAERTRQVVLGDGKGRLERDPSDAGEPCTVPADLLEPIEAAGQVCDVIGPVVIAAQIQYESGFTADFTGPDGARGISQVPPEVFTALRGEEADPLDPEESIAAQGAYLCDLAEQTQALVDAGQATGPVLDLTLSAYKTGLDAVREAGGVPATEQAQSYVVGVRTWFAPMQGIGPPPRTLPSQPGLRDS
ncbi:lytic transglycosylase domain-containing protein [Streptomyces sp. NPDC047097]|uniref:lytic transglycosylase domain-containing protein n=1 Tax=Streptomyces sp. NPDC047097 TaxID=3155260 RepID=UPI0033C38032